jgi:hypothetical protein
LPADATIALIGAGTMGSGIALVAATVGHPVLLHDADAVAIERGLGQLRTGLDRLVERGRIEPQECQARLARITPAPALGMLAPADLVIEAIVEDLDVKASLLGVVGQFELVLSMSSYELGTSRRNLLHKIDVLCKPKPKTRTCVGRNRYKFKLTHYHAITCGSFTVNASCHVRSASESIGSIVGLTRSRTRDGMRKAVS